MSKELVLGFTGDPVSGKSAGGEYLEAVHGFSIFVGSTYLKEQAALRDLELRVRGDYSVFARQLREERCANFMIDATYACPGDRVVNVGVRNRLDVVNLKERGGILVAFYCPDEARFERRDPDDPKFPDTFDAFITAEQHEYNSPDEFGQHTRWAMTQANHVIRTDRPIETMHRALDEIVAVHTA